MGKKLLFTLAAALLAAPLIASGVARAGTAPAPTPSPLQGVFSVNYFTNAGVDFANGADATVRITDYAGGDRCALIYVTDQDQEMRECCGCEDTEGGTLTLSLDGDLTNNPFNGLATHDGSIALVSSADVNDCDPAKPAPQAQLEAWSINLQDGNAEPTETEFTPLPLSNAELFSSRLSLTRQCAAIELVGSGKGVCTCGEGG